MPKRKRRLYSTQEATDLTDAQWAAIAPIVTTTSSKGGRPTEIDLRAIINALISKIAPAANGACFWLMSRWHVKNTIAIQNRVGPFSILVQSQCS